MKYITSALVLVALLSSGESVNAIRVKESAQFTDDLVKSLAEEMQKDNEDTTETKEEPKPAPAPAKKAAPAPAAKKAAPAPAAKKTAAAPAKKAAAPAAKKAAPKKEKTEEDDSIPMLSALDLSQLSDANLGVMCGCVVREGLSTTWLSTTLPAVR